MTDSPNGPSARITSEGVEVVGVGDALVDVLFDGRRIWSFRPGTQPQGELIPWPRPLARLLKGEATVEVRDDRGRVLGTSELAFGEALGRVRIEDRLGRPVVVGGNGHLMLAFGADAEATGPLLAAAREVLTVMAEVGLDGFLAYGTLLGAVREGDFIGHDNDLDLGYVSAATTPVDVIGESFRLQRALTRAGMLVERYSGGGLKVWTRDASGVARGLDVFGGFWDGDHLVLLGEIHTPFERAWIEPLGRASLAGEEFPVPNRPDKLLEAMYGAGWRVPDPSFVFEPGTEARQLLNRWFRGIRWHRTEWDRWYGAGAHERPMIRHHALADLVHEAEPDATVVDVGCGRGRDAAWLASVGHRAFGLDYSEPAMRYLIRRVREHGWPVTYHPVNLLELRHTVGWGARLAGIEGPKAVMARHVVNATNHRGRDGLWRLASMALRGGGRLYLEFLGAEEPRGADPDALTWEVSPSVIAAEAEASGGRVVDTSWFELNRFETPPLIPEWDPAPRGCRMVVQWQ